MEDSWSPRKRKMRGLNKGSVESMVMPVACWYLSLWVLRQLTAQESASGPSRPAASGLVYLALGKKLPLELRLGS